MLEFSAARFDAAVERANLFVTASRQRGDGMLIARSLQLRGAFEAERGNLGIAEADLREAAALAGRFGNRPTQLFALYNLAVTFLQQTRAADALPVIEEGWALCAEQPGSEARTMFRALFVDAYFMVGDWGRAWAHIEPAITEVIAIGQPMSIAGIAMAVLEPMAMLGQWPRAATLLAALDHDALAQSPQAGQPVWLVCAVAAVLRRGGGAARRRQRGARLAAAPGRAGCDREPARAAAAGAGGCPAPLPRRRSGRRPRAAGTRRRAGAERRASAAHAGGALPGGCRPCGGGARAGRAG
jgi:hypothetical protein